MIPTDLHIEEMKPMLDTHPDHTIAVTGGGPFGRAWFDCTCGIARVFASKHAANIAGLIHHHDVMGCNCPPEVIASDVHSEVAA